MSALYYEEFQINVLIPRGMRIGAGYALTFEKAARMVAREAQKALEDERPLEVEIIHMEERRAVTGEPKKTIFKPLARIKITIPRKDT